MNPSLDPIRKIDRVALKKKRTATHTCQTITHNTQTNQITHTPHTNISITQLTKHNHTLHKTTKHTQHKSQHSLPSQISHNLPHTHRTPSINNNGHNLLDAPSWSRFTHTVHTHLKNNKLRSLFMDRAHGHGHGHRRTVCCRTSARFTATQSDAT